MKEKPWESIAEKLMQDIKSGKLPPGEKMPSQNQLAGHYGVPRTHIRKAYEQLEELGYLFSHQGKGTFASLPPRMIPLAMELSGFAKKIAQQGLSCENRVVQRKWINYKPQLFQILGASPQDKVLKISRLRVVDGVPAALHTSYLSAARFPQLETEGDGIQSVSQYLRAQGYEHCQVSQRCLAMMVPTKKERKLLELPGYCPALILTSKTLSSPDGEVLEVLRIVYRGDRFVLQL